MKILKSALSFAFVMSLFFSIGCNNQGENGITSPSQLNQSSQSNVAAQNEIRKQMGTLKSTGVDFENADAIFELGWMPDEMASNSQLVAEAFAIAFNKTAIQNNNAPFSLDMGSVTLNYNNQQAELIKTKEEFGVFYDLFGGFDDDDFHNQQSQIQIPFIPGATYRYTASGSADFDALSLDLTAPTSPLQITSPTNDGIYKTGDSLLVTWQGGQLGDSLFLTIFPDFESCNEYDDDISGHDKDDDDDFGDHDDGEFGDDDEDGEDFDDLDPGDEFEEEEGILVDAAAGSYTIPASIITEFLNDTHVKSFWIAIAAFKESVIQQNNKTIVAIIHLGDIAKLNVE